MSEFKMAFSHEPLARCFSKWRAFFYFRLQILDFADSS